LNVGTINTSSLIFASNIGIGTASAGSTNLYVQGNVYVSNALTVNNLFATTINAVTINTNSFLFSTVGIGASPGTTNLYVQGNVYVSGNLFSTNISAQTIYYGEDIFKRGPYLQPSPANAGTIQAWISATCNASSQPSKSWWGTSPQPVFGNVTQSLSGFSGSVYLPDGRVAMIPYGVPGNIGMYNPATTLFSSITIPNFVYSGFKGGVLVPNGNIVCCPNQSPNIGIFNPVSYAWSNVGTRTALGDYSGGVFSPSGNVVFSPMGGNIIELNTTTLAVGNVVSVGSSTPIWQGVVLLPNGNIVMVPQTSPNILVYNNQTTPVTVSNVPYGSAPGFIGGVLTPNGNVAMICVTSANVCIFNPNPPFSFSNINTGSSRFQGGVLLPSGNIICVPNGSSNVGMIDPFALTYSNSTPCGGSICIGGTLLPSGQVVLTPSGSSNVGVLNTMVPVDPAFCLSPYFNKF
jgi:hypothetical protein